MKLSKREIVMLAVLFIIAIVFVEFRLIITPGINRVSKLSADLVSLEAKVDEININLASIDALTEKRDNNLEEINVLSTPFINEIKPDVLLLFMHDLMRSNLFLPDGYSISGIQTSVLSEKTINVIDLTYQLSDLADQYQQLQNPTDTIPDNQAQVDDSTGSVEIFSVHVTAIGTYSQINTLVDQIQTYNRTMTITGLNIYYIGEDQLQLDLTVQFIGIKKLVPVTDDFTVWPRPDYDGGLEDPYGNIITPNESEILPTNGTSLP